MDTTSAPPASAAPAASTAGRVVTIAGAVAVALGGLLHLRTWDSDYRDIPDGAVPGLWVVKVGFPVNAVASLVAAIALVALAFGARRAVRRVVLAGALLLEVGSIAALVASRGPGIFGWTEKGYEGDAVQLLVAEVIAVVLLVAAIVLDRSSSGEKS